MLSAFENVVIETSNFDFLKRRCSLEECHASMGISRQVTFLTELLITPFFKLICLTTSSCPNMLLKERGAT
jgi:hypothetical protein